MVVNFIGASGAVSRASRRNVSASAIGSPAVRTNKLKAAPSNACCHAGFDGARLDLEQLPVYAVCGGCGGTGTSIADFRLAEGVVIRLSSAYAVWTLPLPSVKGPHGPSRCRSCDGELVPVVNPRCQITSN
jgi:hypothetical protein